MIANKIILGIGIVALLIPIYDQVAFEINKANGDGSVPFIWQGSIADVISENWLSIIAGLLILLAAFVPLG